MFTYLGGDRAIWVVVMFKALLSLLLVYSSIVTLAYKYQGGNTFYYVVKHGTFVLSGFVIIYLVHRINYRYFSRVAQFLVWLVIPLLLLTLVMGNNINNASRWLTIPIINQSFQTSDLAKIALIMYIARFLALKKDSLDDFSGTFLPVMGVVVLVVGLILPANLSTALVLFMLSMMLMFMAGVSIKNLLSIIPVGVIGLLLVVAVYKVSPDTFPRFKTWEARIERFGSDEVNANGNYQADQAKIAIATGGVFGKGPGNSTQRNFLPSSFSDFIYAIVIEEYGFVGGTGMVFLYLILLYRSIKIVKKTKGSFAANLVLGLSFGLVIQGLINMMVNVNLLPVTGQTLPLVSMGGTSMWFTSIAVGIILSVSRSVEEDEEKIEEEIVVPKHGRKFEKA
ncbi:MAG: cell division protein FtsW [Salibacteraceae bacterium]|jgi:cell division protein FtsW